MERISRFATVALLFALGLPVVHAQDGKAVKDHPVTNKKKTNDEPIEKSAIHHPVLWHDPGNIAAKDLYYGQGGDEKLPKAPYVFEDEDKGGTSPKLDLRDANGKKWHIKVSEESQPEVVASRLLWAVGYYANDDYCIPDAQVQGMKMSRGNGDIKKGHLVNARFSHKPDNQKKIAIWKWDDNPFYGTREFNGLRVMMAVMNNWDLKDVNNSVYRDKKNNRQIFLVNDVGATFGTNGLSWTKTKSKGNIASYKESKFIQRLTDTEVDFATPKAPTGMTILTLGATTKTYLKRNALDWIGNNIPRADARWMGSLLGQLTHQQLMDAFRAGNFPPDVAVEYVTIIENRIQELKHL